jgi:hypothetical protein
MYSTTIPSATVLLCDTVLATLDQQRYIEWSSMTEWPLVGLVIRAIILVLRGWSSSALACVVVIPWICDFDCDRFDYRLLQ